MTAIKYVNALLLGLLLNLLAVAQAQSPESLHARAEQLKTARAELLAPRSYARLVQSMQELDKDIKNNTKPERLQKKQAELQTDINKTQQLVEQSSKTLATTIKAYDDALMAGAAQSKDKFITDAWSKAEQRFKQAIAESESNDVDGARSKGAEAEVLLRDVELLAIKYSVLNQAREVIAAAQLARVPEFAPRSFAMAQQQLTLADQQVTRSRYELSEPQRLAAQASYEARHAQYLASLIERAQSRDGPKQALAEQQLLAIEEPIGQLVTELEIPAVFDQGYSTALQAARTKVQQQQMELITARQDLHDRDQQITDLNAAIKKLETRLGGESEERQALVKQLSAQERLRDNIGKIEAMFSANEGRVYRQGNQLIVSLNAISFRSGKSNIEPASFPVLAKVGDALKLFPLASMTIEGHTDSNGSDSANLLLSQDRADAVRQYLISNLGIATERVSSIGYGEAKPIASNDTDAGRARNRRIDVVMEIGAAQ